VKRQHIVKRTRVVSRVIACALLALVAAALDARDLVAAERVDVADITISFANPRIAPPRGIPADSRDAGTEPDPVAGASGTSNISLRIVRDPSDHGALMALVDGRIRALDVTWADPALLPTDDDAARFLRRLLSVSQGSTSTYVPWAQGLGVPTLVATVEETDGARGSWHVWYAWPSVYSVYRDGRGTWWFSHWMNVGALRLP
jgi:hypothetical protein